MALKSLLLTALALSLGVAQATPVAAQDAKAGAKQKKEKKDSTKSKSKEVPTEKEMEERKAEAEALPLFKSLEPLSITLIANYKAISRDRDTLSTKRFPARIVVAGSNDTVPVQLRTRGHYRLAKCSFVPLRIEFTKKAMKGSVFEGQKSMKLGTHCQKDDLFEQYVLREYLAYRIQSIVSPIYFRVRLAHATYVDSASGNALDSRWALMVESEEHMAARAGGVVREMRRGTFDDVEQEPLMNMSVFEYMIGNTDFSMFALHNIRIITSPVGQLLPVPYDFDFSGLVDARYATPDPKLPIKTVRDRLFRGPCKSDAEWKPVLDGFRSKKEEVLALYDSLPGLDKGYAKDAKQYLNDFFRTLDRAGDTRAEIIQNCLKQGGT